MYDIFLLSNDPNDHQLIKERFPLAKFASSLDEAKRKSLTKFFWIVDTDCVPLENFYFDYKVPDWDKKYVHIFKQDTGKYGGIFLIPKMYEITKKEAQYNFFVNRKDIDIVASKKKTFDIFYISEPNDYYKAQQLSKTSMFYAVLDDVIIDKDFYFDYEVLEWDKTYAHIFKQDDEKYDGVFLIPKHYQISKREAEYNFFINNKKIDVLASTPGFEIVFISYDEPNADENWNNLKNKFPYAKRIDKIDGIHNAHIAAAKITNTSMIWVVDGDAIILDNFNFNIEIPKWDRNITHVCKSKNPINGLEYGYGGVKLLPRRLLLEIKTDTVDMTTSISKDFKTLDVISNITAFNTDAFNTWKSAFRECVKLSSKVIEGQIDDETQQRLEIWCTRGQNQPYGHWALIGAQAGRKYGQENLGNKDMLSKINDWKWLQYEFNKL